MAVQNPGGEMQAKGGTTAQATEFELPHCSHYAKI